MSTQNRQTYAVSSTSSSGEKWSINELQLPKAIIARIAKNVLPDGTALQKEAKTALGNATTVFISYLTAVATEVMKKSNQRTLQAKHVFDALKVIEMDDIPHLQEQFNGYKAAQQSKRSASKIKSPHATAESPENYDNSLAEFGATNTDEYGPTIEVDDFNDEEDYDVTGEGVEEWDRGDKGDEGDEATEEKKEADANCSVLTEQGKDQQNWTLLRRTSHTSMKRKLADECFESEGSKKAKEGLE